ncbi:hypothetical protein M1D96_21360 [Pseudomonas sp. D1-3]
MALARSRRLGIANLLRVAAEAAWTKKGAHFRPASTAGAMTDGLSATILQRFLSATVAATSKKPPRKPQPQYQKFLILRLLAEK